MSQNADVVVLSPAGNEAIRAELEQMIGADRISHISFDATDSGSYETDLLDRTASYLDSLERLLERKVAVPPSVFVLGHTGCSYLADLRSPGWLEGALHRTGATHVVTAVQAVEDLLVQEGIKRIELVTPYPRSTHGLAVRYWRERGFDVVLDESMAGFNGASSIYDLTEADVAEFIRSRTARERLASPIDAVLISGTGASSLGVLDDLESRLGIRVVSVNRAMGLAVAKLLARDNTSGSR